MSEVKKSYKWIFEVVGALLWTGASVIAAQLIVGWIMIMLIGAENFEQPVYTAVYSAISYSLALILVVVVPSKLKFGAEDKKSGQTEIDKKTLKRTERRSMRRNLGLEGLLTWKDLGLAPIGYVIYLLLAAGITGLFMLFPWFDAEQVQDVGFNSLIAG